MPLIKRYPNRKLYDTEAKRYVTLDDIAVMVREERDVRVLDHETGEDVTSLTLTQIILEQEKKSSGYLSRSLLTNLIRSGESALETWRKSLQQGIAGLGAISRLPASAFEENLNRLKDQGKLTYEQAQNLLKLDGLLGELLHSLNVPTQRDLQTLQEQVEVLNNRLTELSEPAPPSQVATEAPSPADHPADASTPARDSANRASESASPEGNLEATG